MAYEEYSSFIKEIYERDFGLTLKEAQEQSLSLYKSLDNYGWE